MKKLRIESVNTQDEGFVEVVLIATLSYFTVMLPKIGLQKYFQFCLDVRTLSLLSMVETVLVA